MTSFDRWSAIRNNLAYGPYVRNRIIERARAQCRGNPVPERMPRGCAIALWIALALVLWGAITLIKGLLT